MIFVNFFNGLSQLKTCALSRQNFMAKNKCEPAS